MSKLKLVLTAFKNQKMKFLLVFLVTFVTLLIFNISSSLKESVVNTRLGQLRDLTQNSQIIVSAADGSYCEFDEAIFFDLYNKENSDYIQDQITRDYCYAEVLETETELFLFGTDIEHQEKLYAFQLEEGTVTDWKKDEIMVSSDFAKDNKLQVGDRITLQHGKAVEEMKVKAIAKNEGMFQNSYNLAVTSQSFIDQMAGRNGLVNRIDLTLKELEHMDEITSEMNEKLEGTGLAAVAKYNLTYFQAYVTTVVLALNLFSIFLILLSIYMLYSLFQSYVYENVGQMATLRSIGFSIAEYRQLLCMQAVFVVLTAFLCSFFCTPFVIRILGKMMFQQDTKVAMNYGMTIIKAIVVFFIAVFSIYLASYKVSKAPVVSVIRNHMSYQKETISKVRAALAAAGFIVTIICAIINKKTNSLILNYAVLIGIIIVFLLLQDLLIRIYGILLHWILKKQKRSLGLFGKQVKTTLVSYLPAITTVAFVLTVSMVILSMSDILNEAMDKMYSGADLYMTIYSGEYEPCLQVLEKQSEIDSYVLEQRKNITVEKDKVLLAGIATDLTDEEYKMLVECETYDAFRKLEEEHTMIISDTLAKKWKKKTGDKITVGNVSFSILDVMKTFENMGEIMFISEKSFEETQNGYDTCAVLAVIQEGTDLEALKGKIQEELDNVGDANILTTEEMNSSNKKSNQVIIKAIMAFAVIILLVSGIGLCSVVMINILLRQREFVIYQTVGIPKASILTIAFLEGGAVTLYGILNAIAVHHVLLPIIIEILSYYVGNLQKNSSLHSSVSLFVMIAVLTITVIMGVTKKYALSDELIEKIKVS